MLLLLRGFLLRGFERQVPFVHRDDHRPARLLGVARDGRVVRRDAHRPVHHQHRDVRALQVPPRHDHAQFFGDQLRLALAANSRGVEKTVRLAVALDHRIHRVARRARLGETIDRSAPTS